MDPVPLVNRPNITAQEATFMHREYVHHAWCQKWNTLAQKREHRSPLLARRGKDGPLQCELCGRRASRTLQKIVLKNCDIGTYSPTDSNNISVPVTYYQFRRLDLQDEGLGGHLLIRRLLEELI